MAATAMTPAATPSTTILVTTRAPTNSAATTAATILAATIPAVMATPTPAATQPWPPSSRPRPGGCPGRGWGPDPAPGGGADTRVVQPGQRLALAVRDGGWVFPACDRPLAWCEAHHLWHWLDGGPTDLANLVLLCRAQHRAVHEGGWQLTRQPDGQLSATPPHRPSEDTRPRRPERREYADLQLPASRAVGAP